MIRRALLCLFISFLSVNMSFAAHPLITDDTGTQGKGKFQFELTSQISFDRKDQYSDASAAIETTKKRETELKAAIAYGIIDNLDVILGAPYQWKNVETGGSTTSDRNSIADISLEVKWRFFEKDGFSFALKPGITLPTGDKNKDLGVGRSTCSAYFIATKELNPLAIHLNLGYKWNDNSLDQREDIWHASLAGEMKVIKDLKLVANVGTERNPDKASVIDPAFVLGGLIYSITDKFDFDLALKNGLNRAEKDVTFIVGITMRF